MRGYGLMSFRASALILALACSMPMRAQTTAAALPAPYATPSVYLQPKVIPKPAGARLQSPAGFEVEEFASGFKRPRFMALGPSGEVLVADSAPSDSNGGSVYVLAGPERKVLLAHLDRPYGMA